MSQEKGKPAPSETERARRARGAACVVSVRMPLAVIAKLRAHCAATGESQSATVARLIGAI